MSPSEASPPKWFRPFAKLLLRLGLVAVGTTVLFARFQLAAFLCAGFVLVAILAGLAIIRKRESEEVGSLTFTTAISVAAFPRKRWYGRFMLAFFFPFGLAMAWMSGGLKHYLAVVFHLPRATEWLYRDMESGSAAQRWRAVETLDRYVDGFEPRLSLFDDSVPQIRRHATELIKSAEGIPRLQAMANSIDDLDWMFATAALLRLGETIEVDQARLVRAANLGRMLDDTEARSFGKAIGWFPVDTCGETIWDAVSDCGAKTLSCFASVNKQRSRSKADFLMRGLSSANPVVVRSAIMFLGFQGDPSLLPSLKTFLESADPDVRTAAKHAVAHIERGNRAVAGTL